MGIKTFIGRAVKARKRRRKLASSDVVIVSAAKSGRTWLAVMISHVYHQRFCLPHSDIIRGDNFYQLHRLAPRILFTHDNRKDGQHTPLFRSNDFRNVKTLLLVRDPRDVAVSAHFQFLRNTGKHRLFGVAPEGGKDSMFEYVALHKMPHVIAFLQRWAAQWPEVKAGLIVRYEDLRQKPKLELKRIMQFIDGHAPADFEIEQAVAFASFDSLKQKEASNFFATDRLRPSIETNPNSFKVRRGKVGGYQDYFLPEELERLEMLIAEAKLDVFGYLPDRRILKKEPTSSL
jgi:hypothetical protein